MLIRYLKVILVVFVGLTGLLFVAGNTANWNAGLESVGYVLSMEGHEIYGSHIFLLRITASLGISLSNDSSNAGASGFSGV